MKATDLIHGGYYLLGEHKETVRFNVLNGHFYTLDNRCIGQAYENAESGQISCLVQGSVWMEILPIPVTLDIIKKNGFIKRKDHPHCYEYYESPMQARYYFAIGVCIFEWEWLVRYNENIVKRSVAFVHELQRALRFCGLNELADNFEV